MDEIEPRHACPLPKLAMTTLADGTREWRVGVVLHREDGSAH
jgi:hypothetical protein